MSVKCLVERRRPAGGFRSSIQDAGA